MADETQDEGQIQEQPEVQESAENPVEEEPSTESPPAQVEDWQSKAAALEERLARQEERNRYLEQTARLLEENTRRYAPRQEQEQALSPELAELEKTLSPLFKKYSEPTQGTLASVMDGNDALRFEMYLMRNHPDVLDSEDAYNRVAQQVEQVRQQAANYYGKYLSRVDAFLYAQGLEGVKEKSKQRASKKQTQVKEEAKRQLEVQAAKSGVGTPERKVVGAAAVESALRKMRSGERTTPEERELVRKHLANAQF